MRAVEMSINRVTSLAEFMCAACARVLGLRGNVCSGCHLERMRLFGG